MNQSDQPATRADVEEIVERIVTKSVGSATTQILTAVGDQFSVVIDQLDSVDSHINRLENKVNNVSDDHEVRITKLEQAA